MCRHIAYLGPARALADLLIDRPHGLVRQSYAPREMRHGGTINADGFGAGWYPDGSTDPLRYRRDSPIWSDQGFATLATAVRSEAVMGAVRCATSGMPVVETANAPFTFDGWLFSHNGKITGWPTSMEKIAAELSVLDLLTLDAPTDSALLAGLLRDRLRTDDPVDVVRSVVADVHASAPESRLNLLLTDGTTVLASTWGHSLYVLAEDDQVVIASEPWDADVNWRRIPDRHLVLATRSGVHVRPLDDEAETS